MPDWEIVQSAFSPEECNSIIQYGLSKGLEDAKIGIVPAVREQYRKSKLCYFEPEDENRWLFERLTALQQKFIPEDLYLPKIQFTKYDAQDGSFYSRHTDGNWRVATVVIQLSQPEDYTGSELFLYPKDLQVDIVAPKEIGTAMMFHSDLYHEVKVITSGIRYSLVAWFLRDRND
jgi:PKHD-type hydroxylase